jgi:hypothetical protein
MKQYDFSYLTINSTVTIDEFKVHIKNGPFIKKDIPLASLQYFYVFPNNDYKSLYWVYTNDKGKRTKFVSMSGSSEPGFAEMCNDLQQQFPEKSLNNLPEKEAFKTMNIANPNKWAPVIAFLLIFLVLNIFFYPGLRHYFDFGFSKVQATELINGSYSGSRNISVSGILLDKSLEETTTTTNNGSTTTTVSEFIPMVDENWKEGDPVKVFLSFDKLSDAEYSELFNLESHTGVIRDIAWEGMSNDQVKFFKEHYSMNVDKDPVLVEITNQTHNDSWAFVAMIASAVILGILFLIIAIKRRKNMR